MILPSTQLPLMRGYFVRIFPMADTRRSVCVTLTPCDFSTNGMSIARDAFSAEASRSRATKKCGTVVQLCVVRSAMMRPIVEIASAGPEGAMLAGVGLPAVAAAAAEVGAIGLAPVGAMLLVGATLLVVGADVAARSTSSASTSPLAPEPLTPLISTPCSRASRRAFGDDLAPATEATAGVSSSGATDCAAFAAAAPDMLRPDCCCPLTCGTASPAFSSQAIV